MRDLLAANKENLTGEWLRLLSTSSDAYRKRPISELQQTTRMAFDANMTFIFKKDRAPLEKFVSLIVEKRIKAFFRLSEVQNSFELFREISRPLLIRNLPMEDLPEALSLVDKCVNYSVHFFSERYQKRHEEEILSYNQILSTTLEKLKCEKTNAMAANKLKDQFLANISHELRTPLTSIIGFSKVLMDINGPEFAGRDKLRIVYEQGKILLRMINTLLLIAEINAGTAKISKDDIELKDVLEVAIKNVQKFSIAENREIAFSCPENIPHVLGDPDKLMEVFFELIYNALKFSPSETGITVECGSNCDSAMIKIKDKGIGIDSKEMENIFTPFFQMDGSLTRQFGGNGLGLAMIKKVIDLHDGKIKVESKPGKGSVFIISIPSLVKKSG